MIKIKEHLKEFLTIVKIVKDISYETDYSFTPEGIKIKAVDPSGTYLGIFNISKDAFDKYEIEKEQTITLQNDLFSKLIKKVGKTELNIKLLEDKIQVSNNKDKFILKFFIGQADERPDPSTKCTSLWNIDSSEFSKIITDMSSLGDVCQLISSDDLIIKMKSNMVEGETITTATKIQNEKCKCYYDLNFLSPTIAIKDLFENIILGFGNDTPCVIEGNNAWLNFVYTAAQRAE